MTGYRSEYRVWADEIREDWYPQQRAKLSFFGWIAALFSIRGPA